MKTTILAKVAGLVAAGAVAAGGLNVAGAIPGPFNGNGDGDSVPEPAQQGQTFAAAMQEWAACVGEKAPAHDPADGEFDPVAPEPAGCGEKPHPSDFDEIGEPDENGDLPEPAQRGQAFAAAMKEWAACVGEAAAAREGSGPDSGPFDPFEACGEQPHPSDFGIGGGGPPEATPSGPPEGTPSGPPTGTPSRPPEGTPSRPPEGTPSGPPEGTPSGPPEGTPSGPPEGVPAGRP